MTAKAQEAPEQAPNEQTLGSYADIKRRLLEPIPDRLISEKPVSNRPEHRNMSIKFVNITDIKDILDIRAGVWESTVTDFKQVSESLCCVVRIAIHADDGIFVQDGTGIEPIKTDSYGDPFSNAYSQALRRAAEGHGLGRELWRNENSQRYYRAYQERRSEEPNEPDPQKERAAPTEPDVTRTWQRAAERFAQSPITPSVAKDLDQAAAQFAKKQQVGNPMAQTLSDMITSKQLGMVRALSNELGINADEECSRLLGCTADELSKRAASDFIEHLQELQKNGIPQAAPAIDYIGTGEAKKKEAKLRQLGAALNNAGVSVPLDRYAEPTQWSSGTLNDYCLDGFDIALADLNKAQMDTLIGDLNDMLQERLAMAEG